MAHTYTHNLNDDDLFNEIQEAAQLDQPRGFFDLVEKAENSNRENVLLNADNNYLTRGSAALFNGPTGVGKSSGSTQMDILWAMGRDAFGIEPARPLKILTVQAENDDDDAADVPATLSLALEGEGEGGFLNKHFHPATKEEFDLLGTNYIHLTKSIRGGAFLVWLDAQLARFSPDMVRIDPLFSFVDFDLQDTSRLSTFLRAGIDPLLKGHDCGAFINHHTPKTTGKDTRGFTDLDFTYLGAGAAELANWARAILHINETGVPGTFEFIAAKRGKRIGWKDADGNPQTRRMFMHHPGGALVFWRDADAASKKSAKVKRGKVDAGKVFESLLPQTGKIEKKDLLAKMHAEGVPKSDARDLVEQMLAADPPKFHEWKEKRARMRDRVSVSRQPQPATEPPADASPHADDEKGKARTRKARS